MTSILSPRKYPDHACRTRYMLLERECRQYGLNTSEIEKSAHELCHLINNTYYLIDTAYKPTGIALGCPLPDQKVVKRLWRISLLIDKCLTTLCNSVEKTFAFVPSDWYHVTLLNRSHFDLNETITIMTDDEKKKAGNVIAQVIKGSIVLHFNGLILTTRGRLVVPGFPSDDSIYELRSRLTEALPQLRSNVPATTHIKLGHLLVPLDERKLKVFLNWVALCGIHVSARLIFHDVYMPDMSRYRWNHES